MVTTSIVMTVYNRDRYVGAAIESILAQTYRDFELLIWDDGSSDNFSIKGLIKMRSLKSTILP